MPYTAYREVVDLPVENGVVGGNLSLPAEPRGVVLFAHGSGSGRNSPRNNQVAAVLRQAGLGTLVMDLLTEQEDRDTARRFDIALLARRLALAADWLEAHAATASLPLGLFGASTGAAAALRLAAEREQQVVALVARGGRPDLAGEDALAAVRAPSLFIVGSLDTEVLALNRRAMAAMRAQTELLVVQGATHLFEEQGALDKVAEAAAGWFTHWLGQQVHR
jgi:dienelactone hydrolase